MIALALVALAVTLALGLCGAVLATTRPPARSLALEPSRPAERISARRERIVERFDRWGRPMRITEREILEVPARELRP